MVKCSNEEIPLWGPLEGVNISRTNLGLISVITDLVQMTMLLLALWFITYFIRLDSERHKNLLFETQEFGLQISNVPKLSSGYDLE